MKTSKFSEERIAYVLRSVERGRPSADLCRAMGVSEAIYIWKKRCAPARGVSELRHLSPLEGENAQLNN